MKRSLVPLFLLLSIFLGGCSWLDGSYVHVERHQNQIGVSQNQALTADDVSQLQEILKQMISTRAETATVYVDRIGEEILENTLVEARSYIMQEDPVGAFAVGDVTFELGTKRGRTAAAVTIRYSRSHIQMQQLVHIQNTDEAEEQMEKALRDCRGQLAMLIETYQEADFVQMGRDLAQKNMDKVMEFPVVTESVYGTGESRVVEVNFTYESSREALRLMQNQVKPIFNSASLYVTGNGSDYQKLFQLYGFLMERFTYKVETSITPAYSLLLHGVGDSRAFALTYAAMCRNAGLSCEIVTGTRGGEPWTWNRVRNGESWYHLDLLKCSEEGRFFLQSSETMDGYVWDYSEAFQERSPVNIPMTEPEPQEDMVENSEETGIF